jgi:hypothetical protein
MLRIRISKAITAATKILRMLTAFPIQVLVPSMSIKIFLTALSYLANEREKKYKFILLRVLLLKAAKSLPVNNFSV